MHKTLKDLSEIELKAVVYDQLAAQGKAQEIIKVVEQELAARGKQKNVAAKPEVSTEASKTKKHQNNVN